MPERDRRVPFTRVEGYTHNELQGQLATTPGHPFNEGHVAEFSIVRVKGGRNRQSSILKEIGPIHRRSFELGEEIPWEDEHGNLFLCTNIKGNNLTTPAIFRSGSAPSGFLPYGLQEGDALVRVLKASEILRSKNVDTEAIIKVIEPSVLPFGRELVSQEEYKSRLVKKLWDENAQEDNRDEGTGFAKITRDSLPALARALDNMIFFFTIRGLQIPERIEELYLAPNREELNRILGRAFYFVDVEEGRKAKKNPEYKPEHFSTENLEDIKTYLVDYLPRRLATNFAKMHKTGLVQGLAHYGNVSAVGSIYDLDTVKGNSLGLEDGKLDYREFINDIIRLTNEIWLEKPKFLEDLEPNFRNKFLFTFYNTYFKELGVAKDVLGYSPNLRIDPIEFVNLTCLEAPVIIKTLVETEKGIDVDRAEKLSDGEKMFELFEAVLRDQIFTEINAVNNNEQGMSLDHARHIRKLFAGAFAHNLMDEIEGQIREMLKSKKELAKQVIESDIYKDKEKFLLNALFFDLILKELGSRGTVDTILSWRKENNAIYPIYQKNRAELLDWWREDTKEEIVFGITRESSEVPIVTIDKIEKQKYSYNIEDIKAKINQQTGLDLIGSLHGLYKTSRNSELKQMMRLVRGRKIKFSSEMMSAFIKSEIDKLEKYKGFTILDIKLRVDSLGNFARTVGAKIPNLKELSQNWIRERLLLPEKTKDLLLSLPRSMQFHALLGAEPRDFLKFYVRLDRINEKYLLDAEREDELSDPFSLNFPRSAGESKEPRWKVFRRVIDSDPAMREAFESIKEEIIKDEIEQLREDYPPKHFKKVEKYAEIIRNL